MTKTRLEAFSDGVIAILITIMVLELKVPHGADWASVRPTVFTVLLYVLSYAFLGIYWSTTTICCTSHITSAARSCGQTSTCCSGSRSFRS